MTQTILTNQYNNPLEKELLNLFHQSNLPNHFNKTGYKDFTNYQRISLILLFKRSKKAIRDFLNELKENKWVNWLQLARIPKKSTFHDWLKLFNTKILRKLNNFCVDISNLKIAAIDGSGVQRNFRSPYYEKRLKDFNKKVKKSYHKLDIIVDTQNKKQILDYSFLLKNRNDSFVAKKLLKKIKFRRCKILADKGYPDFAFLDMAKKLQNNFISPPKNYGERCRHDNHKRRRKKANFESNKYVYRRRVIVEAVFSSIKRVQDLKLRSRLSYMKKREMAWHILLYNIRRNITFSEINHKENVQQVHYFFITILIIY